MLTANVLLKTEQISNIFYICEWTSMHDFFFSKIRIQPFSESLLSPPATCESCVPVEMQVIYYKNNLLLHIYKKHVHKRIHCSVFFSYKCLFVLQFLDVFISISPLTGYLFLFWYLLLCLLYLAYSILYFEVNFTCSSSLWFISIILKYTAVL